MPVTVRVTGSKGVNFVRGPPRATGLGGKPTEGLGRSAPRRWFRTQTLTWKTKSERTETRSRQRRDLNIWDFR